MVEQEVESTGNMKKKPEILKVKCYFYSQLQKQMSIFKDTLKKILSENCFYCITISLFFQKKVLTIIIYIFCTPS